MNTEKTTPAVVDRPSMQDILAEMTTLVTKIQDTTAAMQREDVNRFIHLSLLLAAVQHSLTAEAHDFCTKFKEQVEVLATSNGTLADMFVPKMCPDGGHAC